MSAKTNRQHRGSRRRRGQGMTEYIVLVGLLAIVLITAVHAFSGSLQRSFNQGTARINHDIITPMGGTPGADPTEVK
jgi:Flp pilus assembly pilin Flp